MTRTHLSFHTETCPGPSIRDRETFLMTNFGLLLLDPLHALEAALG